MYLAMDSITPETIKLIIQSKIHGKEQDENKVDWYDWTVFISTDPQSSNAME